MRVYEVLVNTSARALGRLLTFTLARLRVSCVVPALSTPSQAQTFDLLSLKCCDAVCVSTTKILRHA